MIKSISMVVMATMLVAWVVPSGEAAVTCGTVVQYLTPCLSYISSGGPMGQCCSGIKGLYGVANTTPDRQSVCNCLKSMVGNYRVDLNKAAALPGQCGVNLPYKISPSTNCASIH